MVYTLHEIGILSDEERADLSSHDFTHNFATSQTDIDLLDALTAGFLPYKKSLVQ